MPGKVDFSVYIRKTEPSTTMIASIVATLTDDAGRMTSTIDQIASRPGVELGEYSDSGRKIPLTIEGNSQFDVETTTRWIQELSGVSFGDVIFVHFEASDLSPATHQ